MQGGMGGGLEPRCARPDHRLHVSLEVEEIDPSAGDAPLLLIRRAEGSVGVSGTPWQLDDTSLRIAWRGHWLPLTPVEFRILRRLLAHPGRVFSRAQLLDVIHDDLRDVSDRAIDSHIKNLRRKIMAVEPGCDPVSAVYGLGYRFELP